MDNKNLTDTALIFEILFSTGMNGIDWNKASQCLETPKNTIEKWYLKDNFPALATKLLNDNLNRASLH
jgi:hypothetical protein